MPRKSTVAATVLFLTVALIPGQTRDPRKLEQMTLQELLDLKVLSATKIKGFSIVRAPSVIRVFTREDIDKFGFHSLRDILINVPGIQIQEYRNAHQVPWIRGIKSRYNNKVLWLVDGVPLRDSYYGHNAVDEFMPLDMVERVEIINGPGSVLYGANAFTGVVSITTKGSSDAPAEDRAIRLSYGTYDTKEASVEFGHRNIYAYANYYTTSGFHPPLNADGKVWDHPQHDDRAYGLFKFSNANFEGTFSFADYDYAETYRKAKRNRTLSRKPVYGSMRYQRPVGDKSHLKVLGYYEFYRLRKEEYKFKDPQTFRKLEREFLDTSLYGVDVDLSYQASRHSFITGFSYQGDQDNDMRILEFSPELETEPGLAVPGVRRHTFGFFAQEILSLSKIFDLTGGIRYDVLSDFENQFSYRAGLTGPKGRRYGKVLFRTAFRVPSFREYLDPYSFNFSLQPERLQTLEGQIGWKFSRGDVSLTLYRNHYTDLIKELFVEVIEAPEGVREVDDEYAINADSSNITGLELQTILYPTDQLSLNLGVGTLLSAKETIGPFDESIITSTPVDIEEADSKFLSDLTAHALLSYQFPGTRHRVGMNAIYYSDRDTPVGYQSGVPEENRDLSNADGFFKLDVFSRIHLSRRFAFDLKVGNVFDQAIYSPPFDNPEKYDIEWPGRTFRAELVIRY